MVCSFSRGHRGPLTSRDLRWQHQTDHFAVRLSQCSRNGLRVDVHRRSNIRMSQQFLLHLEIDSKRMKQRRMAVSERVPADPAYPCLLCSRNKPVLLNPAWPIWFSSFEVCEYPII